MGIQNRYYTQLLGCIDVMGVMMHKRATPVGRKRRKGAQIAASLASLKKFCTTSESPRLFTASSHKAMNTCAAWPNEMES